MSHQLRFTDAALDDIERLYRFLAEHDDRAADIALDALEKAWALLGSFPFAARKVADDNPLLRELLVPFGASGYVALYEIVDGHTVTILAVRHQREDDYH